MALREIKFDANGNVILPRLVAGGKFYMGPEWAGCSNTGARPVILKCKYSDRYLVGTENSMRELHPVVVRTIKNQRVFRAKGVELWAYKGRKAAVAHFSKLCREILNFNDKVRRERATDIAAAQRGDIGAALRLGDY
jgi:hypothetical protein